MEINDFIAEWNDPKVDYVKAYTSGSTGTPKPVRLLKSDMWLSAQATCRYFSIGERSRLLLPLSVDYIAGKMMVVRSLCSGAELIAEHPSNTPLINDYGDIDLMAVVPTQLPALLANPLLPRVRNLIVGGAPVAPEMESRLRDIVPKVFITYGMTETCSHVALRSVSDGDNLFKALPGFTFATDSRGCLVIESESMSFGRLVTNDIVCLENPEAFKWLGRVDNVVNSGGIKLMPEMIERKLAGLVSVPFFLIGRQSDKWGQELVMVVESSDFCVDMFMQKARKLVSAFELPKQVICLESLPRTNNGKIRRTLDF